VTVEKDGPQNPCTHADSFSVAQEIIFSSENCFTTLFIGARQQGESSLGDTILITHFNIIF
jgi:hypothetical protein